MITSYTVEGRRKSHHKEKPIIAFDTEDDGDGNCHIINFYDGKEHRSFLRSEDTGFQLRAWDYIKDKAPAYFWACNLEYDLINVFGDWLGQMVTLQYTKGGLIRGSFRDSEVTFFDSLRHWPIGVKGMGEYIGKPKIEVDGDFINLEYCRRDTEIVYDFVSVMLERYENQDLKVKATLPAMTIQLMGQFTEIPKNIIPLDIQEFFRRGYYGGRVEIFDTSELTGKINYYDFNSLYPSVMKNHVYPQLDTWLKIKSPDFSQEGMADIELYYPDNNINSLPVKTEKEIIYPYGKMRGTWCYPEIRQAIEDGAKINHVYNAIEFSKTCRPFYDYVSFCYEKRLEAKEKNDKLDDVFYKLMMNSLYGKFAMGSELFMIYNDKEMTMEGRASYVNVIWSAYVTCYGRLKLLKALRSVSNIFYCDTDSLFTFDELETGKELGALKLEGSFSKCKFLGNKIYTLTDGKGKVEEKAKGVNKSVAGDFIRTGRAVYRKPMRYRESRKSLGGKANKWYFVEKELKKKYEKRKINLDGTTRAWDLQEYYQTQFIKENF